MPYNPQVGTSGTGTNQSSWNTFLNSNKLQLSSDNPYSSQMQSLVSQMATDPYSQGAKLDPQLMTLMGQAKTWETQNQGTSPAQRALNTQITQTATQFQNNIPTLEYNLTAQAAQAQKQQLATAIEGTKNNYNARGLLYSTAEQGGENANVQTAANNVTTAAADINQTVAGENEGLQHGAIANQNALTALNQGGTANQASLTGAYNSIAEQNQALQAQALGAVGQGIGSVLGTGAAALTNPSQGAKPGAPSSLSVSGLQAAESQGLPTYNYQSGLGAGTPATYGGIA